MNISVLLEKSCREHDHLCPRQVLGVRLGVMGLKILGFTKPPSNKRLVVISETDGCFVDGVTAATDCTVGHRTLRVQDFGKTAAVFIDTLTAQVIRVAPSLDIRKKAEEYAPEELNHYDAQLLSYKILPDELMFTVTPVVLNTSIEKIISRPGIRVNCDVCGEEIMNERERTQNNLTLCQTCAGFSFYHIAQPETQIVGE